MTVFRPLAGHFFDALLESGAVYYFRDKELTSSEPHSFVVLNSDPKSDEVLILVCASTKVEKRLRARRREPKHTLVVIPKGTTGIFAEETVFDCNSVFSRRKDDIKAKFENGWFIERRGVLDEGIVGKLMVGVLESRLVGEREKAMLRNALLKADESPDIAQDEGLVQEAAPA
jgi:hypothetical protein